MLIDNLYISNQYNIYIPLKTTQSSILKSRYLHSTNFFSAHLIQILHFKNHSGVHPGGEGKSSDHDPSTVCVSKIQPFACLGERWKTKRNVLILLVLAHNKVFYCIKYLQSYLSSTYSKEAASARVWVIHLVIITINHLQENPISEQH